MQLIASVTTVFAALVSIVTVLTRLSAKTRGLKLVYKQYFRYIASSYSLLDLRCILKFV